MAHKLSLHGKEHDPRNFPDYLLMYLPPKRNGPSSRLLVQKISGKGSDWHNLSQVLTSELIVEVKRWVRPHG